MTSAVSGAPAAGRQRDRLTAPQSVRDSRVRSVPLHKARCNETRCAPDGDQRKRIALEVVRGIEFFGASMANRRNGRSTDDLLTNC